MNSNSFEEQTFLNHITEIIRANLQNEQFGVSILAQEIGMSRSNLHRKIKTETGKSVSQFINEVRLEKAGNLLLNTSMPVSEIAYDTGFHSVSYFSKCFHEFFGVSPRHFRNKNKFFTSGWNRSYKMHFSITKLIILIVVIIIVVSITFLIITWLV